MKKTLSLVMLLWVVTLAACSADEPQTISATEDYNREFVKEFGVPAAGHDFSMTTSAGLKVTSANGDHITVTAEIDGEEYLFADCHVPAGTTAIPVTIPRSVSELKLATPRGTQLVATNALVNLDEIKTQEIQRAVSIDTDLNPILVFKQSDFLDEFFNAYPEQNKFMKNIPGDFLQRGKEGYIFPVYVRTGKNSDGRGRGYYNIYVCEATLANPAFGDLNSTRVYFSKRTRHDSTLNGLFFRKYHTSGSYSLGENSIYHFFRYSNDFSPYPDNANYNENDTICSQGIRLEDFINPEKANSPIYNWFLEVQDVYTGPYYTISESPYRNASIWKGYYDVPLQAINNAYMGACHYPLYHRSFLINDVNIEGTTGMERYNCRNYNVEEACLIGFSFEPTVTASADPRDYCDVVFLYIPTEETFAVGTADVTRTYEWTIAAEDLGATDDWDFNDAVFTFSDQIKDLNTENIGAEYDNTRDWGPRDAEPVRVITVTPKAAGGTMPLYITYTGKVSGIPTLYNGEGDSAEKMYSSVNPKGFNNAISAYQELTFIVGEEIHAWLGADSYTTMINTGGKNQNIKGRPVEFAIPVDTHLGVGYDSESGTFENSSLMASVANKTLCGFAVLVDRDNTIDLNRMRKYCEGMHVPYTFTLGEGTYVIGRPDPANGEIAPQMILVNNGYWKWPQERVKISEAYPDFAAWLANPSSVADWTKNYVKEKVTY